MHGDGHDGREGLAQSFNPEGGVDVSEKATDRRGVLCARNEVKIPCCVCMVTIYSRSLLASTSAVVNHILPFRIPAAPSLRRLPCCLTRNITLDPTCLQHDPEIAGRRGVK